MAIRPEFSRLQPIERFCLFRKQRMRGGQVRILFFDVIGAMPQKVSKQAARFVIEIMPGCECPVPFARRKPVEHLALHRAAYRTDAAPGAVAYFHR